MTKINHARPSLKLADNIKRELNKHRPDVKGSFNTNKPKNVFRSNIWQKMNAIGLSDKEENLLFDLIELSCESFENLAAKLEQFRLSKKSSEYKRLEKIETELRDKMLKAGRELVVLELTAKLSGRKKGIGAWLELLKQELKRLNAPDIWDLLNNDILKNAMDEVEASLSMLKNNDVVL